MPNRRMFSMKIVDTDAFLDMPQSAQLLYYSLAMRADDDGFVSNPKKVMRMVGSQDDDYKILSAKKFIIVFESGICVIKHWLIHNLIRTDRYIATQYTKEMQMLIVDQKTKKYSLNERGIPNVIPNDNQETTEVRLGKDSLDKVSLIDKEAPASKLTPKEQAEKFFNNIDNSQLKVLTWLIEKGVPRSTAELELKKFINYWSELTPSGKKQKWQTKPTFEVGRRLGTWFSNFDKFIKVGSSGGKTAKI